MHPYLEYRHEEDPKPYDPYVKVHVLNEIMVLKRIAHSLSNL